jgi:predicted metal-dependent hydrolase
VTTALIETRISLADGVLACRVVRARGRRMVLRVTPQPAIEVRAPRGVRPEDALAWARSRRTWIEGALERIAQRPAPLRFAPGEVHHVRGVPLRLRIHRGPGTVELLPGALVARVEDPARPACVEGTLRRYYRELALQEIPVRVRALSAMLPGRPTPAAVRVRLMRRRWGSCGHDGVVTLSTLLARAAPADLDYVIAHELCHLRVFDHGADFYALLDRALPDWRMRRARLEALPAWPGRELLGADS